LRVPWRRHPRLRPLHGDQGNGRDVPMQAPRPYPDGELLRAPHGDAPQKAAQGQDGRRRARDAAIAMRLGTCYAVSFVGVALLISLLALPLHGDWVAQQVNTIRFLAGVILYGGGMAEGVSVQIERRKQLESESGIAPKA